MNKGSAVKLLVFILSFSALAFAQEPEYAPCSSEQQCCLGHPCPIGFFCHNNICRKDVFLNPAVIMLLIIFAIAGIAFAIGKVLDHPRILQWAESEVWETIGTAVIVIAYLGIIAFLDNSLGPALMSGSIAYPGEGRDSQSVCAWISTPTSTVVSTVGEIAFPLGQEGRAWGDVQNHVQGYIKCVQNKDEIVLGLLIFLNTLAGLFSSWTLEITVFGMMIYFSPFAMFGGMAQFISTAIFIVASSIIQLQLQLEIVKLGNNLFSLLLPLGILLRALPLTRMAGSALIAIAIGFTVVLPIGYLLIEDVTSHYYNQYCDIHLFNSLEAVIQVVGLILTGGMGDAERFIGILQDIAHPGSLLGCAAFIVAAESFLFPMIAYLITLNITKNLAEVLGTHIDFSTMVRLI
jgi:hypothetical protein